MRQRSSLQGAAQLALHLDHFVQAPHGTRETVVPGGHKSKAKGERKACVVSHRVR